MKRLESVSQNIKKVWHDHPSRYQLLGVPLSNLCNSDLYNSEDYSHLYQVLLDGISVRIMQFECLYGDENKKLGFRTVGFISGIKIETEFIIFNDDEYVFDYHAILNAFVFGR